MNANEVQRPKRYARLSSGHILGIVNPLARRAICRVAAAQRRHSTDGWRAQSEEHAGTWWENRVAWLSPQCGLLVVPLPIFTPEHPTRAAAVWSKVLEQ